MNEAVANVTVGFVGLGAMGGGMARHLHEEGVEIAVHDVSPEATQRLADEGVTVAQSLAELGRWAQIVVLMLPHPDFTIDVVMGKNGLIHSMAEGTIVIDMSTDGPAAVQRCHAALAESGIRMIDSPVGRDASSAARGELMLLVGGEAADIQDVRWLLDLMGSEVVFCGPVGNAQVVKLVNNLISIANVAVIAEAYGLAVSAGVDADLLTKVMSGTGADSWQLRNALERRLPARDFSLGFRLDLAKKDLELAVKMADTLLYEGLAACTRAALEWYCEGSKMGFGDLDQCALLGVGDPMLAEYLQDAL